MFIIVRVRFGLDRDECDSIGFFESPDDAYHYKSNHPADFDGYHRVYLSPVFIHREVQHEQRH